MILFENLIHPQIRLENDNYKYYWKVIIGRRDLIGPIFEIAGFMEEEKANEYIENFSKARDDWDNDSLFITKLMYALPHWNIQEETLLKDKINYLKKFATET